MRPIARHLLVIAVVEGFVLMSAVLRLALGGVAFERPGHLAWFMGVFFTSSVGVVLYVARGNGLSRRESSGEDVSGDRRQALGLSLAVIVLAGLISAVGPGVFERLFGG